MCPQIWDGASLSGSVVSEGFARAVRALSSLKEGTTVRGLARRSGVSVNRTAQVVTQLSALGLVRVESVGSAKWCHWNPSHPAAGHLAAIADLDEVYRRWLAELLGKAAIKPAHASVRAETTGGHVHLQLPLEILLIRLELCSEPEWLQQRAALTSAIRDALGTDVEWTDYTPADLRQKARSGRTSPLESWATTSVPLMGPTLRVIAEAAR
jgi:hypothetical protein